MICDFNICKANMVFKQECHYEKLSRSLWFSFVMMPDHREKLAGKFHKFGQTMSNDQLLFQELHRLISN